MSGTTPLDTSVRRPVRVRLRVAVAQGRVVPRPAAGAAPARSAAVGPRVALTGAALLLLTGCAADGSGDGADGAAVDVPTSAAPTGPGSGEAGGGSTGVASGDDTASTQGTTGTPDPTGTPGSTVPPEAPPDATSLVLTEEDSGAQIALAVGQERALRLGNGWSWSEPVATGGAVTVSPVEYLVDPGYVEWSVAGTAPGSATVEVLGEPACGDTTVCPPTTVALVVDVTG